MPYFNTGKTFLFPSFDLQEKEREEISKSLTLLDNSGAANRYWVAPGNLETETFKKPSWKRLSKKGVKSNAKMKENRHK